MRVRMRTLSWDSVQTLMLPLCLRVKYWTHCQVSRCHHSPAMIWSHNWSQHGFEPWCPAPSPAVAATSCWTCCSPGIQLLHQQLQQQAAKLAALQDQVAAQAVAQPIAAPVSIFVLTQVLTQTSIINFLSSMGIKLRKTITAPLMMPYGSSTHHRLESLGLTAKEANITIVCLRSVCMTYISVEPNAPAQGTHAELNASTKGLDNNTSKNLSAPAGHSTTHIMASEPIQLATSLKLNINLLGSGDIAPTSAAAFATAKAPNKWATQMLAADEHARQRPSSLLHHYL